NHDETFTGSAGGGAFLNGMPITVSSVAAPEQAALATGLPARRDYSQSAMGGVARNLARWHKVRMFGTAATSLAYVAAGRIDAYQESSIMLWDVAAGWALVEAAGGKVRATLLSSPAVLNFAAANFHLLEAFVDM
ncbi:MAG: inositol monophosphatase, partial [Alphaproteobacteria bacterium]|nr:inositol monophosphatase [Alphaproteobacteria bacterium]